MDIFRTQYHSTHHVKGVFLIPRHAIPNHAMSWITSFNTQIKLCNGIENLKYAVQKN